MVSFQCEGCGDVFTKKKLDAHAGRCRNASFTCLDCHTQFSGTSYRAHTSCISEAQKYQGHLYQDKKPAKPKHNAPPPPRPTVEDFNDSTPKLPKGVEFAKRDHIPPAPTPPSAASIPINVFDFLEKNNEGQDESDESDSSSYVSADEDSDRSESPAPDSKAVQAPQQQKQQQQPASAPIPTPTAQPAPNGHANNSAQTYQPAYSNAYFTYGTGAVVPSGQRYDSSQDLSAMTSPQVQAQHAQYQMMQHMYQTPGPNRSYGAQDLGPPTDSRSDKKRKRSPSGINTSVATAERNSLHTGLTGGLNRLLPPDEDMAMSAAPSPLSPKKRSKRTREDSEPLTKGGKSKDDDRVRKHAEKHRKSSHASSSTALTRADGGAGSRNERHSSRRARLEIGAAPARKAIAYYSNDREIRQGQGEAHSAFFLSLIDKGHASVKGQSVWGTLKMFHDGRQERSGLDEQGDMAEERRLLKGLRCKRNKDGEIVLFARPEAEGIDD